MINCLGCNRLEIASHRCPYNCTHAVIDSSYVSVSQQSKVRDKVQDKAMTYKEWLSNEVSRWQANH